MASKNSILPSQEQHDHRAMCKYGENCYQTNPMHLEKFRHHAAKNPSPGDVSKRKPDQIGEAEMPESKKHKMEPEVEKEEEKKNDKENSSPNEDPKMPEAEEETKLPKTEENKNETEAGEEDKEVEMLPDSPVDLKENIKQKFLVEMPSDFFQFWTFCKERNHEKPDEALLSTCGLRLVGPFDIMSGKLKQSNNRKASDYLCHWRYYYDTPEFQTVIANPENDFHIGYFRDDPQEMPAFVASNDAKSAQLKMMGDNLFGAVFNHINNLIKEADPFRQTSLQKLKESLHVFATMKVQDQDLSLEIKTRKMKARDKLKVGSVFNGSGLVVPYNKETEVGYRDIPETTASLKKIFKNVVEAESDAEKDKADDVLQELITNVQFANDEGDPGMGLELGLDAFCFGGERLHSAIKHLLGVGYELVQREEYSKIILAHLKRRKMGEVFKIQ